LLKVEADAQTSAGAPVMRTVQGHRKAVAPRLHDARQTAAMKALTITMPSPPGSGFMLRPA
jgi:hypothetical protein